MNNNNYIRISTCIPKVYLGKPLLNVEEIIKQTKEVADANIVLFPELSVTGYSNGDWFLNRELLDEAHLAMEKLLAASTDQIWIVGSILEHNSKLYNAAYVISNKTILGAVPKMHLPSYREFFEKRIFSDGLEFYKETTTVTMYGQTFKFGEMLFVSDDVSFGIEICEDLWQNYAPHVDLYNEGAHLVFNLSTSTYQAFKKERRENLCNNASYLGNGAYIYVSSGVSETSSDVLCSGHTVISELGDTLYSYEALDNDENIITKDIDIEKILYQRYMLNNQIVNHHKEIVKVPFCLNKKKVDDIKRDINTFPFSLVTDERKQEVIDVLAAALNHRLSHIGIKKIVLGVSGGLDSTLALLVINYCFEKYHYDKKGIIAITIPGLGTGHKSKNNAYGLSEALGINLKEINIEEEVLHHFNLIGKDDDKKDVTYENIQARYRTLCLMNIANKENAIVCGTGDMSEIALGWSTFNGDQMSMYNLNGGLPKTTIRELVTYFKKVYPQAGSSIQGVIDLPISPELTSSSQLTEDIIGKYEINDFIMYHIFICGASQKRVVGLLKAGFNLSDEEATLYYNNFMKRFKRNQFKRLTGPESVKIFSFSFSARSDLHFPGDMK